MEGSDRIGEHLAGDARDGHLASREHVDEHELVGVGERVREILAQRLQARIAMRLEHDDDVAEVESMGGGERRLDLGGMMAVIVYDGDAAHVADMREATTRALERREGAGGGIRIEPHDERRRERGGGVQHVVHARIMLDGDLVRDAGGQLHIEGAPERVLGGMEGAYDVIRSVRTIRDHAAPRSARELDQARVLAAYDNRAVLSHEVHERAERLLDLLERGVVVHVVGLDVGDDDDVGVEIEKRAVGFVGLADEELPVAVTAVCVVALHDAADQEAGVEPHAVEHGGAHRGRRRLAMGAGDREGGVAGSQSGKHLRAGPYGNTQLAGANQLRIRLGNRRGDHDHVGLDLVDGLGLMPDEDLHAGTGELADIARRLQVRTGHPITALMEHQGDAAHAGAADADEMSALEGRRRGRFRNHNIRHAYSL